MCWCEKELHLNFCHRHFSFTRYRAFILIKHRLQYKASARFSSLYPSLHRKFKIEMPFVRSNCAAGRNTLLKGFESDPLMFVISMADENKLDFSQWLKLNFH